MIRKAACEHPLPPLDWYESPSYNEYTKILVHSKGVGVMPHVLAKKNPCKLICPYDMSPIDYLWISFSG